jgi:hypothetical protein
MGKSIGKSDMAPYLEKWGNRWKFRKGIPLDLRPIVGKAYWVKVIKASSLADAMRERNLLLVECDKEVKRLRRLADADKPIAAAAKGDPERLERGAEAAEQAANIAGAFGIHWRPTLDGMPEGHPERRELRNDVLDAEDAAVPYRRIAGNLRAVAEKLKGDDAPAQEGTLGSLVDLWLFEKKKAHPTVIARKRAVLRDFLDTTGLKAWDPIGKATRQHVGVWRDRLEAAPGGRDARAAKLTSLSGLFRSAISRLKTDHNPCEGLVLAAAPPTDDDDDENRRAWTPEEARRILTMLDSRKLSDNGRTNAARFQEFGGDRPASRS